MVTRWVYTTVPNYYGYSGGADASAYRVIASPHNVNNILYGTEENPAYRSYLHGGILDQYWDIYPISGHRLDDYYIRLVGVVSGSSVSGDYDINYDNKTIAGKFRLKETLTGGALQGWRIPLNCEVLLKDGTRKFTNVIKAWSFQTRFTSYSYNGFVLQYVDNNDSVTLYQNIGSSTYDGSSYSTVGTQQEDAILDFGETPQNIPSFLYDYIMQNTTQIFPNSFYIKNADGTETYSYIVEAPTMVSALLEVIGNSKVLTLTGSNNQIYTLEWSSFTPEGKQFSGLSLKVNSRTLIIPIGVETDINLSGDVSFYESYVPYKPIVQPFLVSLYKNSAEANRVDKTDYLTAVGSLNGVMREGSSITDLSITFEMDTLPQFNYVHIPAFNRYYYVDDISTVSYRLWEMALSVDVLMSYKDAILSCSGFIDRCQSESNPNIIDKRRVVEQGVNVEVVELNTDIFERAQTYDLRYVLNGYKINTSPKE